MPFLLLHEHYATKSTARRVQMLEFEARMTVTSYSHGKCCAYQTRGLALSELPPLCAHLAPFASEFSIVGFEKNRFFAETGLAQLHDSPT